MGEHQLTAGAVNDETATLRAAPGAGGRLPPAPGIGWIEARAVALEAAIKFLKARCILVSRVNRDSDVCMYRMSGFRGHHFAEEVIDYAAQIKRREARAVGKMTMIIDEAFA